MEQPGDGDVIVHPLLNLLETHKLDFHSSFRRLCFFRPSILSSEADTDAFIASLNDNSFEKPGEEAMKEWRGWLGKYAERLEQEKQGTAETSENEFWVKREKTMKQSNPRFVLRQWVLEEIIKRVQDHPETGKRALAKVLEMVVNPYEPWGSENEGDAAAIRTDASMSPEEKEERRMCGLGPKQLLGFQCSCSS